jgi:hypothetical protein
MEPYPQDKIKANILGEITYRAHINQSTIRHKKTS